MTWTSTDHRPLPPPIDGLPYSIVFVCTGNICRSPMAEVITRQLAEETVLSDGSTLAQRLNVTSAGTGPWHEGEPMDPRTGDALERGGYARHPHVAHQFTRAKIDGYDLTVVLDRRHQQTLRGLGSESDRLFLLRHFDRASGAASDVPDPYYGDEKVFDECLSMIADGCAGLVAALVDLLGD